MTHNDVLHQLRYALQLTDEQMADVFAKGGEQVTVEEVPHLTGRRDAEGTVQCTDAQLRNFLDGLIVVRRGPAKTTPPVVRGPMKHNETLKKLRVAFDLKEDDVRALFKTVDVELSKGGFSSLFRKPGHKNYRACTDAMMGKFLRGLTLRLKA